MIGFDKNNKFGNKSQLNNLINKKTLNLDNEEDLYYHECFVFRKSNKIKHLKYIISYNV